MNPDNGKIGVGVEFKSGKDLLRLCEENHCGIGEIMIRREEVECDRSRSDAMEQMGKSLHIMKEAAARSVKEEIQTMGGLIGGEAKKMNQRLSQGKTICGMPTARAAMYAMGMLEVSACMGLITAAPTAGSCGVLPAVLLTLQDTFHLTDEELMKGLFHAGAIGSIITRNATVSGAEGGCQAEVGTASAMAASAAVELMGGTPEQCLDAAATAISNILGLVCDPVRGLVEIPCQKRNAMGAANALVSAEISLAGIMGKIPFDEVVEAMHKVGRSIPYELRETALGGLACAPSVCGRSDKK